MPSIEMTDDEAALIGWALDMYLDAHPDKVNGDTAALAFMFAPDPLTKKAIERHEATKR